MRLSAEVRRSSPSAGLTRMALVYLFVTPLETVPLGIPLVGSPIRVVGLAFIGWWLLDMVGDHRRPGYPRAFLVVLTLFVGWNFLACFWSWAPMDSLTTFSVVLLLAVSLLAVADVLREVREAAAAAIMFGSLVAALPLLFSQADYHRAMRVSYLEIDENILAFHLVVGIAASIYIAISRMRPAYRLGALGIATALFLGVVLTGSRTGFGSAVLTAALGAVLASRSAMAVGVCVVGALGASSAYGLLANAGAVPPRVQYWIENPVIDDSRSLIIDQFLALQDYWFWTGVGPGVDLYFLRDMAGLMRNAHSGFWVTWIELGLIGLAIGSALLVMLMRYAWQAPARGLLVLSLPAVVGFMYTLGPTQSNVLWSLGGLALAGFWRKSVEGPPIPAQGATEGSPLRPTKIRIRETTMGSVAGGPNARKPGRSVDPAIGSPVSG